MSFQKTEPEASTKESIASAHDSGDVLGNVRILPMTVRTGIIDGAEAAKLQTGYEPAGVFVLYPADDRLFACFPRRMMCSEHNSSNNRVPSGQSHGREPFSVSFAALLIHAEQLHSKYRLA